MQKSYQEIIDYYHTKESRWGYKLVLGGTKHFGYYPEGQERIKMQQAMQNMTDKLGNTLNLPANSLVLDAGCGEGTTALRLADKFNLRLECIDILDFNIKSAKRRLDSTGLKSKINFIEGNYMNLRFANNYFDGVYTMETLVHAPDYHKALQEFNRVLKKGAKLVLFEYSIPSQNDMSEKEKWVFQTIGEGSVMHSFMSFKHGAFPQILKETGFRNIEVTDITERIYPMLHRFYKMGIIPYQLITLLGKQKKYVNTTSGVELYRYRNKFRYNIIVATKA